MPDVQFQYPVALWLLALVPFLVLLFFLYRSWKRKAVKKMGDPRLVKELYPTHSNTKEIIKFCLSVLAFVLGCVALANPRIPDETSGEAKKGIDLVLALDVSNSMKATDIEPDRLSRAKQFISRLIDNLPNDRIGLIVFAGSAYVQMPLTFDQGAARLYTAAADPKQIAAQGTSIADALEKADILFSDRIDRFRSVILITDGETHDEDALDKVKELAAKGVMINTVGIGSPQGSTITDASGKTKTDDAGNLVISKLNEQILQQIAAATNGRYVHLQNSEAAVNEILGQFSQIEKKALPDTTQFTYQSFYGWLVLPMLLLMTVESFFPDRKKQKK
jgi:Ca-activated chloride channel family protein